MKTTLADLIVKSEQGYFVTVDTIYFPYLGNCEVTSGGEIQANAGISFNANVMNNNRKSEKECSSYIISGLACEVDVENGKIQAAYRSVWYGGEIELFWLSADIDTVMAIELDHVNIIKVSITTGKTETQKIGEGSVFAK